MKNYILISLLSVSLTSLFFISQRSSAAGETTKKPMETILPPTPAPNLKVNDPLPANLFVELAKAI
ncbi:MAG: serine protease MucD, partial [Bdellovibrionaceae bacterium]|nr:serine protease MucD [Pseudobdellovibrionaceae bacterium]